MSIYAAKQADPYASPKQAQARAGDRLVTVDELAEYLHVHRSWIYEHAQELGAWRLGTGPKSPLRFDLEEVRRRLTDANSCSAGRKSEPAPSSTAKPKQRRRQRGSLGSEANLLPIRGASEAA